MAWSSDIGASSGGSTSSVIPFEETVLNVYNNANADIQAKSLVFIDPDRAANGVYYALPIAQLTLKIAAKSPIVGYVDSLTDVPVNGFFKLTRYNKSINLKGINNTYELNDEVWFIPEQTAPYKKDLGGFINGIKLGIAAGAGDATGLDIRFYPKWASELVYNKVAKVTYQEDDLTKPTVDVAVGDKLLVTTTGTATGSILKEYEYIDTQWVLLNDITTSTGVVLENTITSPDTIMYVGKYIIPISTTDKPLETLFINKQNKYVYWPGTLDPVSKKPNGFIFTDPQEDDIVQVSLGENASKVYKFINGQWVQTSAGETHKFIADTEVKKGYAVRLLDNGHVYAADFTYEGILANGFFGNDLTSRFVAHAYVNSKNIILGISTIGLLPHLVVGYINIDKNTISWNNPVQLSEAPIDLDKPVDILYDPTLDKAVLVYIEDTELPNIVTIDYVADQYVLGASLTLQGGVACKEVKLSSDGVYFYASYITNSNQLGVKKLTVFTTGYLVSSTSTLVNGSYDTHAAVCNEPHKVAISSYELGVVKMHSYNGSNNTWISNNLNVATYPINPLKTIMKITTLSGSSEILIYFLGDNNSNFVKINFNNNDTVSGLAGLNLFTATDTITPIGIWYISALGSFYYSYIGDNGFTYITKVNRAYYINQIQSSGVPGDSFVNYVSTNTDAILADSNNEIYFIGYDGAHDPTLKWESIGQKTIEEFPVVGVCTKAVVAGKETELNVEGEVCSAFESLVPSTNYYMQPTGEITDVESDVYMGLAISETQININFSAKAVVKPSLAIIDNSVIDPESITTPGRYIVPSVGLLGEFIGHENEYADYDGVRYTYSTPLDKDRITIVTGINAGKVYDYKLSTNKWVLSAQVTSLPISAYDPTKKYLANELVIKDNVIYQANDIIPINTVFLVGKTGATFKQIGASGLAEFGTNGTIVDGSTIYSAGNPSTFSDVANGSFTLPSAGTWLCSYRLSATSTNWMNARVVNSELTGDNGVVLGSQIAVNASNNPIEMVATFLIITTKSTIFKLQARTFNNTSMTIKNATNSTLATGTWGSSNITWNKIAGYLPIVGHFVDYGYFKVSGTPATNTDVILTKFNGSVSLSANKVMLKAGNTYRLYANLCTRSKYAEYQWVDINNVPIVGCNIGWSGSVNSIDTGTNVPCVVVFTPTADTEVKLRITGISNYAGNSDQFTNYSVVEVTQMGTSSATTLAQTLQKSYMSASMTVNYTPGATNTPIIFNTKDGGDLLYDNTTGAVKLTAGKTYRLTATLANVGESGIGYLDYRFFNKTTNTVIGTRGLYASINDNTTASNQSQAVATITPLVDTEVCLYVGGKGGNPIIRADFSWMYVEEIGYTVSAVIAKKTVTEKVTFKATTTAPIKATVVVQDYITLIDDDSGWCEVFGNYSHTNASGTSAGSGTYLISLPGGYKFDTAVHLLNTQTGSMSGLVEVNKILPGSNGFNNLLNSSSGMVMVPHSNTQFKLMYLTNVSGSVTIYNYVTSTYGPINNSPIGYTFNFRFKKG